MSDVIRTADPANPQYEGAAIVSVDRFGTYQKLNPELNKVAGIVAVSGLLTDRFDDTQYYSS